MCSKCDEKLAGAHEKAREATAKSAVALAKMIADGKTTLPTIEQWIEDLASTMLAIAARDTLTELIMSIPEHGERTQTNH